ncbi:mycothiol transferase [Gulosibacter faecalis]|jgi:hypothetical protein|uniref:DUF664 domain-containing protein n=1 Tax=Gulosibacter faecalis TaxID=272240 RepID=A0ABW5UZQ3_9MICO|nr:DUF664 domain-containing protein [Gulosibacter faecalis]
MPFITRDITTENDGLAAFAAHNILQVATTLGGLTDDQLRATPSASAMSLGALARHCLKMFDNILLGLEAAPECPVMPEISDEENLALGLITPDAIRADDTAEALAAELVATAERAERLIEGIDLDTEMPVPEAPWFASAKRWNNRWAVLHLIEEAARHAGHADLIREHLDGAVAYDLNDRFDTELAAAQS